MAEIFTKNKKDKEVSAGIFMFSGVQSKLINKNDKNLIVTQPDNIWRSQSCNNKAIDAEKNGGTIEE